MGTSIAAARTGTPTITTGCELRRIMVVESSMKEAQIIDFTSAALTRRFTNYIRDGREYEASIVSALLEGYESGMWDVEWKDGEPYFSAPDIPGSSHKLADGEISDEWLYELLRLTGGAIVDDDEGAY